MPRTNTYSVADILNKAIDPTLNALSVVITGSASSATGVTTASEASGLPVDIGTANTDNIALLMTYLAEISIELRSLRLALQLRGVAQDLGDLDDHVIQ